MKTQKLHALECGPNAFLDLYVFWTAGLTTVKLLNLKCEVLTPYQLGGFIVLSKKRAKCQKSTPYMYGFSISYIWENSMLLECNKMVVLIILVTSRHICNF